MAEQQFTVIFVENLFALCVTLMCALNQLNASKEIKHAKNIQESRVWKCWGHPSTQAPAMAGVRAAMVRGQYQSPNPISLGRFFCNTFASLFFSAGRCQGLTSGPELLSEAMASLRSTAVKSHEETPQGALLPEKYLPSAPLCGLIKAF